MSISEYHRLLPVLKSSTPGQRQLLPAESVSFIVQLRSAHPAARGHRARSAASAATCREQRELQPRHHPRGDTRDQGAPSQAPHWGTSVTLSQAPDLGASVTLSRTPNLGTGVTLSQTPNLSTSVTLSRTPNPGTDGTLLQTRNRLFVHKRHGSTEGTGSKQTVS